MRGELDDAQQDDTQGGVAARDALAMAQKLEVSCALGTGAKEEDVQRAWKRYKELVEAHMREKAKSKVSEFIENEAKPAPPVSELSKISAIRVTVWEVRKLPKMDLFGKCDPYVELAVGNERRRTTTKYNTYDASYGEVFYFDIPDNVKEPVNILALKVWDWDRTNKDDPIGFVHIPLTNLPSGQQIIHNLTRTKNKCRAGGPEDTPGTKAPPSQTKFETTVTVTVTAIYARDRPLYLDEVVKTLGGGEIYIGVKVHSASDLPITDSALAGGKCDPFCEVVLTNWSDTNVSPDGDWNKAAHTARFKTSVKTRELNPQWDEHYLLGPFKPDQLASCKPQKVPNPPVATSHTSASSSTTAQTPATDPKPSSPAAPSATPPTAPAPAGIARGYEAAVRVKVMDQDALGNEQVGWLLPIPLRTVLRAPGRAADFVAEIWEPFTASAGASKSDNTPPQLALKARFGPRERSAEVPGPPPVGAGVGSLARQDPLHVQDLSRVRLRLEAHGEDWLPPAQPPTGLGRRALATLRRRLATAEAQIVVVDAVTAHLPGAPSVATLALQLRSRPSAEGGGDGHGDSGGAVRPGGKVILIMDQGKWSQAGSRASDINRLRVATPAVLDGAGGATAGSGLEKSVVVVSLTWPGAPGKEYTTAEVPLHRFIAAALFPASAAAGTAAVASSESELVPLRMQLTGPADGGASGRQMARDEWGFPSEVQLRVRVKVETRVTRGLRAGTDGGVAGEGPPPELLATADEVSAYAVQLQRDMDRFLESEARLQAWVGVRDQESERLKERYDLLKKAVRIHCPNVAAGGAEEAWLSRVESVMALVNGVRPAASKTPVLVALAVTAFHILLYHIFVI